jgi:hypothetical protein
MNRRLKGRPKSIWKRLRIGGKNGEKLMWSEDRDKCKRPVTLQHPVTEEM